VAGFDAVEIFENDLISFDGNAKAVREMATDLGLDILLFQPFRDFEGMPEPQRTRAFDRAERKFDLMQELGTDLLLICSNLSPDALPGLERAAEDLYELGERAKTRNLFVLALKHLLGVNTLVIIEMLGKLSAELTIQISER